MPQAYNKFWYPPLFEPRLIPMTLDEVKRLTVDAFAPDESHRLIRFGALLKLLDRFRQARLRGEIWIDGSYVTGKIDPDDIDIALRVRASDCDQSSGDPHKAIEWAKGLRLSRELPCHVLTIEEHPRSHPNYQTVTLRQRHHRWNLFGRNPGLYPNMSHPTYGLKGLPVVGLCHGVPKWQ